MEEGRKSGASTATYPIFEQLINSPINFSFIESYFGLFFTCPAPMEGRVRTVFRDAERDAMAATMSVLRFALGKAPRQ
jgi:hypothetical protein